MNSSCTTLYLEAECAYVQNMQGPSENNCGGASSLRHIIMEKQGGCAKLDKESFIPESQDEGQLPSCFPVIFLLCFLPVEMSLPYY